MVTLLASWRWLRLPAYTAAHPGAMLQEITCANAGLGRTRNTCLQLHGERQDKAGDHTSQARSRVSQRRAYVAVGLAHPCMPLTGRNVHAWESRTAYVPLPTALAGNTNENFSPSRRLHHLCLLSFVVCCAFAPSLEQPQE